MQKQKNTDSVNGKNSQLTNRIERLSEKVRNTEKNKNIDRKMYEMDSGDK